MKRKAPSAGTDTASSSMPAPMAPEPAHTQGAKYTITNATIDADYDAAVAKINSGTYTELTRISDGLLRLKDKKIAAADKHRKLQIKNINDLHDYEVQDAIARYQRAYAETQERLIAELAGEVRKLKSKIASANAANTTTTASSSSSSSSSSRSRSNSGSSSNSRSDSDDTEVVVAVVGTRQSRDTAYLLSVPQSTSPTTSYHEESTDENSLANVVHGKERDRTSKRRLGVPNPSPSLDPLLPEESMRADFLEIVQDIEMRAAAFAKSAPKVSLHCGNVF